MTDIIELAALLFLAYALWTGRFWFLVENIRRLLSDPDKRERS